MKVYLVKLDWSTEDSNDIELFVCGTYDKAYEKFKDLIANEMNPDNSWVGELEWENGVPKDDKIELDFLDRRNDTDETECYWLITDTWDYGVRTYIFIEIIRHQQNERTRGQGHNTCPRLRFQKAFRREYKPANSLLHRQDKGADDARSNAAARKLHAIQNILGGI